MIITDIDIDPGFIRANVEKLKQAVKNKNIELDIDRLVLLIEQKLQKESELNELRRQRNDLAAAGKSGKPSPEQQKAGRGLKDRINNIEKELAKLENSEHTGELDLLVPKIPTIPSEDTPIGNGEGANKEISCWGEPRQFAFAAKNHVELGEALDLIDFEKGALVSGYRGYYLKNQGVLLVMALMNYALQKMTAKGYKPMIPPTLVKGFALFGSGYFKGALYNPGVDEIYKVASGDKEASGETSDYNKYLVGTAEPSLLAYFADPYRTEKMVLTEDKLPIRVCGFSPCYRSEIGSYGKDTKGMYRVHEFMKVEQVVVCSADIDESTKLQEEMLAISEEMYLELGLPYRKVQICTGDMSPGKYRAFDLEIWLPGAKRWAEVGSASNFLDWQARRLNVKYKDKNGKKKFAYLLNNTAMASPRPFIGILENYQQADGSIRIPEVLVPYMGGITEIRAE